MKEVKKRAVLVKVLLVILIVIVIFVVFVVENSKKNSNGNIGVAVPCGYTGVSFGPNGDNGFCECWGIKYNRSEKLFDVTQYIDCFGIVTERKCYEDNYEVECKNDNYQSLF